jgi:hypothetical protein
MVEVVVEGAMALASTAGIFDFLKEAFVEAANAGTVIKLKATNNNFVMVVPFFK